MSLTTPKVKTSAHTKDHRLTIGLGVALERLIHLEFKRRNSAATNNEKSELLLLRDALNNIPLVLNASCMPGEDLNRDGKADSVQFFELMASSDCCVLDRVDRLRSPSGSKGGRL